MRFQAVQYIDADFPDEQLVGVYDSETRELYPFQSRGMSQDIARDMNNGRKYSILPFPDAFMLTVTNIQPLQ